MQVIGYSRLDKSAALNVLLLIPTILVFILYRYLMQKNEKSSAETVIRRRSGRYIPGSWAVSK